MIKIILNFLFVWISLEAAIAGITADQHKEILISNPGELVNRDLIDQSGTHLWKTLPYETADFSGVMIAEGGAANIPPVTIPLQIKGKYRICLGLFSGYFSPPEIRVRLSGESDIRVLSLVNTLGDDVHEIAQNIYEVFWEEADLTGQDLIIEPNNNPELWPVALAYLRLEPISSFSTPEVLTNPPMVITADGWGAFKNYEHRDSVDIFRQFQQIPEGDPLQMLIWGNGIGDWCNYPTTVGNYFQTQFDGQVNEQGTRVMMNNINLWKEKGWNSMRIMREYTRSREWEFQVYIRMQGFGVLFPRGMLESSDFFNDHPQYHCQDREGRHLSRLSYAHPEVQDHMLALIHEISSYEPDGICLSFIRGLPMVSYEPIVVNGFMEIHGIDPRELPENDTRWLEYIAGLTTEFVQKVKESLPVNQRLSAMVPGNRADCRTYGADPESWLELGIVDDLIPAGTYYNQHDVHVDGADSLDFTYFTRMRGREKVRLFPLLYPWHKYQSDFPGWMRIYEHCAREGADALAVWDADFGDRYQKVRNIGNIEQYKIDNCLEFKRVQLVTLQGLRVDRFHYFEGI